MLLNNINSNVCGCTEGNWIVHSRTWQEGSSSSACEYWRILLKWNLKSSVWTALSWTKTESHEFVDQRLDLTKGQVQYLHQLSENWRTALHIRCAVPPACVQLSTIMGHRCAHTHTQFSNISGFTQTVWPACTQLSKLISNTPKFLVIPAARNPHC